MAAEGDDRAFERFAAVGVGDRPGERRVGGPAGGIEESSTGLASSPLNAPAKKPMPRCAKTAQIVSSLSPPLMDRSACRIAFRISRNDGLKGDSRIASVTMPSVVSLPSSSRRSHSVCTQISPSECTSGPVKTLP